MNDARAGGVYLVHFERKLSHAQHYCGYASDIDERITEHRASRGARLLQVVNDAGIAWEVVRVWMGASRKWERILKGRGGARRMCPVCSPGNTRAVVQRKRKGRSNTGATQGVGLALRKDVTPADAGVTSGEGQAENDTRNTTQSIVQEATP